MIITGHRGALGTEPENTLRSFRRAVVDGCDEIELDLRVTADGELVIMHDATVDRTTSGTGEIAAMSYDEVRSLDAGLGEVVPTWAETVAEIGVRFQAEVKAVDAIPLLVESLQADPSLAARTLVTSFHPEILLAVRRAMPTASTGRIFGRTPAMSDVLMLTKEAEAGAALCGIAGLTADGVAELQATGLEVTAWPVPDQDTLVRAASLGVNGITTDNPHLLHRVE
ncbi:glycerophosphodiester phosphodiesterase [Kribbella capetownensis]|uniref:Glycerophosphodiester phosphodiesterase n=1 Tax=Kribbella capetownensis TaxID=1572659 RepID=A0A4R0K2W8_9ACTN|nr:glycerophosphodiester phosphodiesterase family protein [Kribbella capetownensis]TCC53427.1 glycerophosphodiester phosphodiesterase [Kribbella capetownensis]